MGSCVKLSSIPPNTMLVCNGEIVSVEYIKSLISSGRKVSDIFTVSQNYIVSILKNVYKDHINGVTKDVYNAPNQGDKVVIDI